MGDLVTIELSELDANEFVLFQKYHNQFMRLVNQNVFEKEFTGRVVLDVLRGDIKNLQKITNIHFQVIV